MSLHRSRVTSVVAVGAALGVAILAVALPTPALAAGTPVGYYASLAGYVIDTEGSATPPSTIAGRFQVPAVTCTKMKSDVGFGVVVDNNDGSAWASVAVDESCVRGKPTYAANINIHSVKTVLSTTLNPNDLITVSASQTPGGTSATFTDNTTGFTQTLTGTGGTAETAAIGAVSDTLRPTLNVPMFPTFSFTNAQVNGADIGTYTAADGLMEAVQTKRGVQTSKRIVQIQPSAFVGTSSFQLTWVS
jgi:hypothetical protein